MINKQSRKVVRQRKHARVRRKIQGTPERPRLCVFRSQRHIYAQVIDDQNGVTLVSCSTLDPELRKDDQNNANVEAARRVGELIANRAKEKDINEVVFDRGGHIYHGRVAALAQAARDAGLSF